MRILYITRHFNHSGFVILERLIKERIPVQAVVLHKDNDRWRKPLQREILKWIYKVKCWFYRCQPLRTIRSEEKLAKRNGIPIIWTTSIKSDAFFEQLKQVNPDIIVLGGGWHELIPKRIFSFPRLGCINTHPSLLPEFRGTSITRWQVLHGVMKSGSTIHYVDDTFDTGGVLAQSVVDVSNSTTPQELFLKLSYAGADLMVPLLQKFKEQGKPEAYGVQHNALYYKYFKRWSWDIGHLKIDWTLSFRDIHFKVLANTQESFEYKGTYFAYKNVNYFLRRTELIKWDEDEMKEVDKYTGLNIYVRRIEENKIFLARRSDPNALVLVSVQQYDAYYKMRRSYPANKVLKVEVSKIFQV